jgi:RNA polymerase sigma factor (sigma-70 family)
MFLVRTSTEELNQEELEEARLGFVQFLRRKGFSTQFIERHGDDLFATAALEYSRKLSEGERIESPTGWLITCAWRRTMSQLEGEARRPHLDAIDNAEEIEAPTSGDPEELVLDEDRFRKVREAVDKLSVNQQKILALSYFEGMTVREAGRALSWHASKAQRAHEGARQKLHDLLGVTSSDDLVLEVGLAAYISLAGGAATGNFLERASRKSAEGLALTHPLRVRILEMNIRMKSRPPSVETMATVFADTPEYKHVKAAEVKYHRDLLLDAKLLPV